MRNSGLVGRRFEDAPDVVRWHGAMQAQDYGPAKWSIGQRAAGLVDHDVDQALAAGSIVRTHVLRPTWHFVAREDARWLLALTGPRIQRNNARRLGELGLDARTLARSEDLIVAALRGRNRLTRDALAVVLRHGGVDPSGQRLPYILMHCELEAVICSGGLDGRQQTYALFEERVPEGRSLDGQQATVELVRRYLASHGPSTVADLRWWASLAVREIREALSALGSDVTAREIDGLTFWSVSSDDGRAPALRGAHLLQAYDELVVGYTESRYFGDPNGETARKAWTDRSLPSGVVMLRDRMAGNWRRTLATKSIAVELVMYEAPTPNEVAALETAVERLGRFTQRPVTVQLRRA
jgi:hypothetical protein